MSHLDPHRRATKRELRSFALLVGSAFVVIAAIIYWRSGNVLLLSLFAVLGGALSLSGLVIPGTLGPVHAAWMRFAVLLSRVTTPILMGVIYFVVLTPTGLLMRAFGRNPLGARSRDTAWVARPAGSRTSVLERQF